MKLNAKMLYEGLRETEDIVLLGDSKEERNLRFPCFYDGNLDHLMAGGVYLVENEELPRKAPRQQDILWVTWGGEAPVAIPKCPVLYFREKQDAAYVLNLLQQVFVRFCSWEEQLDQILKDGSDVKKMIAVSESMFNHPICLVDTSLHYLGYSASFMKKGSEIYFLDSNGPAKGAFEMEGKEPPVPTLFYDQEHDVIVKLHNEDFALGTFYMIHNEHPFTETERLLFELLAEKLTQALENLSMLSGLYRNSFQQQMEKLFLTRHIEEGELYRSLVQWGGTKGDTFICYKVKASHINQKINAEHICSIFENVLYAAIAFWHDSVLVVLVDVTRAGGDETKLHTKMENLLQQLHMKAGVSLPFTDLSKSWYHFRQACCAFEEGYPVAEEDTLYFFQKYVPDYILHHAMGEFPEAFLLDAGMQRLLEHDGAYSVSYSDTLDTFFECRMNMSQTAERLNIHRTSLNSRMQKIWECLDHELTQEYLLYIQIVLAILKRSR